MLTPLAFACYRHAVPEPEAPAALDLEVTAHYELVAAGEGVADRPAGTERIHWTQQGADRVLEVWTEQTRPLPVSTHARVVIRDQEPVLASMELELMGERVRVEGARDSGEWRCQRTAFGRTEELRVGYGSGTGLDVGGILSAWWWIRLVAGSSPVDVRTIVVRPPSLVPEVELIRIASDPNGGLRVQGPGRETSWVPSTGADGWPLRVVTARPEWDRRLERRRVLSPRSPALRPRDAGAP